MRLHAENSFTVTKSLFHEGMLRISRDTYGKFAIKGMLVFFGIWVALSAFTLFTGGGTGSILFSLAIISAIGVWLCIWTPRSNAKKAWTAQSAKYGDSMKRITRFYDDHLEITGDCADKSVPYSDIKEIKHSDHLIILLCHDKVGIMLSREGFTRGDENTIIGLIGGDKLNG